MRQIITRLRKISKDFNLKFDSKKFDVFFLPKEDVIIYLYLVGCPDKEYSKYGNTQAQRINNIEKFLNSKEFSILKKKYAGTIVEKKALQKMKIRNIKNSNIRARSRKIVNILKNRRNRVALLPVIRIKRERKFYINTVLFHEWIHTLLLSNGINFQKKTKSKWYLDEGLANYLMLFSETGKSDVKIKTKNFQMKKGLLIWNKLLKNKLSPKERYDIITSYFKK